MTSEIFEGKVAILDGGFVRMYDHDLRHHIDSLRNVYVQGTTLEELFHKDISAPLWSAKPVDSEPQVIVDAHLAFLRAGCDIILTST